MLNSVEHEKSFITSGPGFNWVKDSKSNAYVCRQSSMQFSVAQPYWNIAFLSYLCFGCGAHKS